MKSTDERRQFLRSPFDAQVRLLFSAGERAARLLDISLKGALVDCPGAGTALAGQHGRLRLELAAGHLIVMDVTVVHVDGERLGLRCDQLDVDSMTHLRQLLEHNAQDPALLERELALLLQR